MAVALLVTSALLVLGAVASGSFLLVTIAAVLAVALGGAATKITQSELADARVQAARDRADQARDYAAVTERKTAENLSFALDMRRKISAREEVISGLEGALISAQKQAAEQTRKLSAEARRADLAQAARREGEDEVRRMERSLASSEDRAADAIVLVAELEAEIDVLKAELTSWRTTASHTRASTA